MDEQTQPQEQPLTPQSEFQPGQFQPEHKPLSKKFIITIVGVLVLAGAVYGGIWWWNKSEVVVPTPTPDPTANWQTYRNEEYGFEFKYPGSFTIKEEDTTQVSLDWCGNNCNAPPRFKSLNVKLVNNSNIPEIVIDINSLSANAPIEYMKKEILGFSSFEVNKMKEGVSDGTHFPFVYYTFFGGINHSFGSPANFFSIYVPEHLEDIFDQILSTFKFIDSNSIDANTQPSGWNTIKTCVYLDNSKKDISFNYPSEIKLDTSLIKNNCLGLDMGDSNFTLFVLSNSEVEAAELTTDIKNIFYTKIQKENDHTLYSLYKADLQDKTLFQLDSYLMKGTYNSEYRTGLPAIVKGYLVYNWFIKDPTMDSTDFLRLKIVSMENNKTLFTSPCDQFNFDITPDKMHIVLECKDGIYLSDWKTTSKFLLPASIVKATRVSFIDDSHLGFVDASKEISGCNFPSFSIDLSGQDLKQIGTAYLCF